MGTLVDLVQSSKRLRSETRRLYVSSVRLFEGYCGGDTAVVNANVDLVEHWRDGQLARGLNPDTINVRILALRFAAKRLADRTGDEALARAARATELLPSVRARRACTLTVDDVSTLLTACAGDRPADIRDRAIITLATRTGLRRGGIAGIEIADYKPPRLTVTLKGGTRHTLPPLDEETIGALSAWHNWLARSGITSGRLFRGIRAQRDLYGKWVVSDSLDPQSVYRAIRERGEQAGLTLGAHTCRHFFVTFARSVGWPDWYIAQWTGHRSSGGIASSFPMLDTYTHSPIAGVSALPRLV